MEPEIDAIASRDLESAGIKAEILIVFSTGHKVAPDRQALGAESNRIACHGDNSPLLYRAILVDHCGEDGQFVYETLVELAGTQPPCRGLVRAAATSRSRHLT